MSETQIVLESYALKFNTSLSLRLTACLPGLLYQVPGPWPVGFDFEEVLWFPVVEGRVTYRMHNAVVIWSAFSRPYQITDFKAAPHKTSQCRLIRCVRRPFSPVVFTRSSSSSHQTLNKCKCACLGFSVHHSTRFVFMKDTMNLCPCARGKRIQKHPSVSVNHNEEKKQCRERSFDGN